MLLQLISSGALNFFLFSILALKGDSPNIMYTYLKPVLRDIRGSNIEKKIVIIKKYYSSACRLNFDIIGILDSGF